MPTYNFQYNKPEETSTIEQFIACQSDTEINYQNLSFVDSLIYTWMNERIKFPSYNVVGDYLSELRSEYCVRVTLSDADLTRYRYRPKLLCHDIYGKGELFFIILLLNDMCSVKSFNRNLLLMPTKDKMIELCKYLYNANIQAVTKYSSED